MQILELIFIKVDRCPCVHQGCMKNVLRPLLNLLMILALCLAGPVAVSAKTNGMMQAIICANGVASAVWLTGDGLPAKPSDPCGDCSECLPSSPWNLPARVPAELRGLAHVSRAFFPALSKDDAPAPLSQSPAARGPPAQVFALGAPSLGCVGQFVEVH